VAANEPVLSAKDFHLGAEVFSGDGRVVGKLVHVLVDADYRLQALVVEEGRDFSGRILSPGSLLVSNQVIVPKDAVKAMTHSRVELGLASADIRRLPPYLHYAERSETLGEEAEDFAAVLGSGPDIPGWLQEVANKPDTELEIDQGENVMLGRTGRKLGEVQDVLFDGDQLVGVVLKPEGFFQREVILPRRFLDRSDDAALFAQLDENDLKHLTPFDPE
jgi:sporulation protein YlmC with PRC-barrel domain